MLQHVFNPGFTALTERYSMSSRNSSSGAEKLSAALNSYIGEIVENIIGSEGDILKFAGWEKHSG